jgi:hypothetical protein
MRKMVLSQILLVELTIVIIILESNVNISRKQKHGMKHSGRWGTCTGYSAPAVQLVQHGADIVAQTLGTAE